MTDISTSSTSSSVVKAFGSTIFIFLLALSWLSAPANAQSSEGKASAGHITHGPVLGAPGSHSMTIWVRTERPGNFNVSYMSETGNTGSATGQTKLNRDNTGTVELTDLEPNTRYDYIVSVPGSKRTESGSFRTMPHPADYRNAEHNPEGLYNFSFEHGSCNYYRTWEAHHPAMPTYHTMNEEISNEVHFQIMNGDFIYENGRGMEVKEWRKQLGVSEDQTPEVVEVMPKLVGIWENYKRYYEGSPSLRKWHRNVPAYFMFDDHEILNDINGAGTPGHDSRKALHRDIGIKGWYDYVGWSNPIPEERQEDIIYGKAEVNSDDAVLHDPQTDFSQINFDDRPTLHVHWTDDHPAAGVYKVEEVLDNHRIKLSPKPEGDAEDISYSIGRRNYYSFKKANAEFFVTDTRSARGLHDQDRPEMEGLTMLGEGQKEWLMQSMKESDADFLFVVSSVSFTIPHVATDIPNKDESWTVFLDERDQLFNAWDKMEKPVVLLTGDLHNGIAVNVSDNIHEFVSGPHESGNHDVTDEGGRPANGKFTYNDRTVDILWSSYFTKGTVGQARNERYYVVFDIKNVVNNPTEEGDRWIAYPRPQLVVQYYSGNTGNLVFSKTIRAPK